MLGCIVCGVQVHLRKKALLRHESEAGASREAVSHIRVLLHEVEAAEEASDQLRSKLVAEEQQWILKVSLPRPTPIANADVCVVCVCLCRSSVFTLSA